MDNHGFPLWVDSVKEMAFKLVLNHQGQTTDTATMALGKNWITRFLDRHPQLASKFSTQVKKQRIINSSPKILKQSFDNLGPIIRQYNIQPYNIYNMDEKGLQMGKSACVKVICIRGRKSPPLMTDGNRELVMAIETVGGDGTFLPPMIIYKGQAQLAQWHQYLTEEDKDTIFSTSLKGWTN